MGEDKRQNHDGDGVPAQLHEEYVPTSDSKLSSEFRYHGEAAVDIVLVHGLGSKYETTWAYKRNDGTRYHWIREKLPKDMPDARVLGFEYPSRWYNDPVHTDLTECASQMLRVLIRDRCHAGSPTMCRTRRTRPIILIGHSFGGLVIKQAMIMAGQVLSSNASTTEYENHRDLLSAISGVIFLGTPHRGSSFALFANWTIGLSSRILRIRSNEEIIAILKPDSYTLNELQRQFAQLCIDERMADLKLVCYHEMRDVTPLKKMVVSRDSAILDNSASRGMDANHMDMNTFYDGDGGRRDNNYDHFISDIRMIFQESQTSIPNRFNHWVYGSLTPDPEREKLQRLLDPSHKPQDSLFLRKLETHQSAPYTCQWIHNLPVFKEWRQGMTDQNTLWISGTAGSGKSVLAAYIINFLQQGSSRMESMHIPKDSFACYNPIATSFCGTREGFTPILFFFCGVDRKSETPERMVGTLIHQLLLSRSESQELFEIAKKLLRNLDKSGASSTDLVMSLCEMVDLIGSLYIVIDNLEDVTSPEKFLETLSVLRDHKKVRILISSQYTKEISVALASRFDVERPLLVTDYSSGDICRFTEARGAALFQRKPLLKEKEDIIIRSLQSRAQGMFQWVNSALEHLKYVEDPRDVEPQLDDIRGELLDTYDKIFERLALGRDDLIERRIQVCLKFIAASATPVTSVDVKIAWRLQELLLQDKEQEAEIWAVFNDKECDKYTGVAECEIQNYLGSIVDVYSDRTLHFKHPSILRALIRTEAVQTYASSVRFKFTLEDAHRTVSQICMTACRVTTFIHANAFTDAHVPLVQYAWNYWAYHLQKSKFGFTTVEDAAQIRNLVQVNPSMKNDWDKQAEFQMAFNKMIDNVSRDALLYVEALMDFISRPLRAVPGRFSDREYILSLQRAQESLLLPAQDLCALRKSLFDPISSRLQHAQRKVMAASEQPVQRRSLSTVQYQAADKISGTRSKMLGEASAVRKLHLDEYLETNPGLPRPAGSQRLLLDISRNLRVIALRFAVDPIYSALLATASGSSFSPLHPLVYLAQLFEESGVYPYWDALPPTKDLMSPFICQDEDPEYASAKFVLHCFEWRDPRLREEVVSPTNVTGFYMRSIRTTVDARPSPSNNILTRVSTENWEQVRRLHQLKPEHFYAAQSSYALFQSDEDWLNKLVANPLSNLHMKFSLLVHEHEGGALTFDNPSAVLNKYAPTEIQEAPLRSFVRSLPSLSRVIFVRYVIFLLQSFGQITRRTLTAHFAKIEAAVTELRQAGAFLRRVIDPGQLPPIRFIYFIPALLLFWLRCVYFPSWGAYFWYHSWMQFSYAYKHPAVYLDLQNEWGFWSAFRNLVLYFVMLIIGNTAVILTVQQELSSHPVGHAAFVYSLFHCFCTIDRSLFAIAAALATLIACGKIMFYNKESVVDIFKFSLFFWFNVFLQLVVSAIQLGALERGTGWFAIIGGALVQVAILILCTFYATPIIAFLYSMAKPVRLIAMWAWGTLLRASVFTAQMLGIVLIVFMAYKAFWSMHKFIWDPYDIEDSLKNLLEASQQVHKTLNPGDRTRLKRIGWYPLGTKIAEKDTKLIDEATAEMGPPRAVTPLQAPLQELHEAVSESIGMAAGGVKGYFESGEWERHRKEIGGFVDRAVLTTGDQVGKAIDEVGDQVGWAVDELGVGKALAEGTRQVRLLVRDAVHGPQKEE